MPNRMIIKNIIQTFFFAVEKEKLIAAWLSMNRIFFFSSAIINPHCRGVFKKG
jgi:hypothetical protein